MLKLESLIFCLFAASLLSACGQPGGDTASAPVETQAQASTPTPQATPLPGPTPIDYSKVACGTVEGCANACNVRYPYADPQTLAQTICGDTAHVSLNLCNNLAQLNAQHQSLNSECLNNPVTTLMGSEDPTSAACGTDPDCYSACQGMYIAQSDQDIMRPAAARGLLGSTGTMAALYSNLLVKIQHQLCTEAPISFIMGIH